MRRRVAPERLEGIADLAAGLSAAQVAPRRERFGANEIVESVGSTWRELARDTARDPMPWFLLGTGALFALLGDTTEALVLFASLVPFLGMDAFLHRRTQASTQGLRSRLAARARVLRDGAPHEIPAADVVAGDLLLAAAGEPFAADGILVGGESMQVDESALTGEAYPVRKEPIDVGAAIAGALLEDRHWALAGTRLLTGVARVRVLHTGAETLYGEIVRSAVRGSHARTPLQVAIASLVRTLVVAALVLCAMLAWVRIAQGHGWLDGVLSAVTLAVAALPEEFPVVFTFFLGVGVYRLARRQALVRRAVVVESIGWVSTICTDKTGTITEGQLRVAHVEPAKGGSESGVLRLAALASRSETGDPLDAAVLRAAGAIGPVQALATFPFAEDRKRETAVVRDAGQLLAATKGAPETILRMCALGGEKAAAWRERVDAWAGSGHKVIAVAAREVAEAAWPGGEPDRGFELAGLLACEDPVRPGVPEAVEQCRSAGIHVIMVTGDHPATAAAVAAEIRLGEGRPAVVLAEDLERRIERGGAGAIGKVDVVARAVPAQKLALVRALQAAGEVVAVTGDGVNDVPALQAADVGIAMGERGTRSAREVAAIVLLDDNFRSLARAIAEGRQLGANLRLAFAYLLMIHIPLVVTAALVPLAGYPLLYLPVHVVWLELVMHPTALLVFQELPPAALRRRRPRRRRPGFFGRAEWGLIVAVGALVTAVIVASYDRSLDTGHQVAHARATALVALTVASATVTAALSRLRTRVARAVVASTLGLSVLLVQTPRLSAWLHLEPLHADDWAIAGVGGLLAASLSALTWAGGRRRPRRGRSAAV
jgi:Ca2+-transporting ATPase